ncbi:MAG: MotA/TolQ/ExbB proton channel family protein [Bacteriovoracaceae bacterium]|nr:MotA/TolQ/ExbB proton channel family protein [Bacteriovoracaceae bacterium]
MENVITEVAVETSFIKQFAIFMNDGGIFMWIIFGFWAIGVAISLERVRYLFKSDIDASSLMNSIKKHVLLNEVQKAITLCSNSASILPYILRSGLKRANQTKEQIHDAIESTVLEVVPKVEKRLSHLGLIANISTLLGLLGTIYGLIQSFGAVAAADPAQKAKLLAMGISKAMNTTAFGLISAISIMVIHALLVSKSDKIISDVDEYATKLIDLLGTKKNHAGLVKVPVTPNRPKDEDVA